jgi:hypothetical protein
VSRDGVVHGSFVSKEPTGFGFESRNAVSADSSRNFSVKRCARFDARFAELRYGCAQRLSINEVSEQGGWDRKSLKSLRRGAGTRFFAKRLRVRIPSATKVVVAQSQSTSRADLSRRKNMCCGEGGSSFGDRKRAYLRSALEKLQPLVPSTKDSGVVRGALLLPKSAPARAGEDAA